MKIGLLFPGYGSQFVGMGKELYDDSRIMQEYFEEASNCLNMNFVKLCFASSDAELSRMENAYPALFLMSSAIAALLKQEGIIIDRVAGYNIGEYAAIHTVGGFSFPDGLYLLSKYQTWYTELLANLTVEGMRIRGITSAQLQTLCAPYGDAVDIAVYEAWDEHIVMGNTPVVDRLRTDISQRENVSYDNAPLEIGLHSALMDPVVLNFKLYLEKVDFKNLQAPLVTNADAKIVQEGELVKYALIKQIHSPVLWYQTLELYEQCDVLVQVGPGTTLTAMMQARYPEKKCIAINKKSDIDEFKKIIQEHSEQQHEEKNDGI